MHGTNLCYRFVSNRVAMNKNLSLQRVSAARLIENVMMLVVVTFLLGSVSLLSSRIPHGAKAAPAAMIPASPNILKAFRESFLQPYVTAWERITPSAQVILSALDISTHTPHIPTALSSTAFRAAVLYCP